MKNLPLTLLIAIVFLSACSKPEHIEKKTPESVYQAAVNFEKNKDYASAAKSYKESAEQGNVSSQHNLAVLHYNGQGVAKDYQQAAAWYLKAASKGDAQSQYQLARMYDKGEGVQQSFKESANWYAKAAVQGRPDAMVELGFMYFYGEGVPLDAKTAYAWFLLASAAGYERATDNMGIIFKTMTPEDKREGEKIARTIKESMRKPQ